MKTIAQQINWDFEANGILRIKDRNGKIIYSEYSNGYWLKFEYDSQGNLIYSENSNGVWVKWEYDSKGNEIYYEDSYGRILDNRPKSCEDKVVEIEGVKFGFNTHKELVKDKLFTVEDVENIWKYALGCAETHDKYGTKNKSKFIERDVKEFIQSHYT